MERVWRRWPWVAAILLHVGLLALLALPRRPAAPEPALMEIEVTALEPAPRSALAAPELVEPATSDAEADADPVPARRMTHRAGRAAPAPAPRPEPAGGGAMGETADSGLGLGWGLGALGEGSGMGGGGGGRGGGGGARGTGAGRARVVRAATRPLSRARPPRLVYPKRFRDERDGEVFVALLTIDEDGWVVGVRLVQGVNPHSDEKALTAVWRFHYEPALDAAGRPTRAKVHQRFMVD